MRFPSNCHVKCNNHILTLKQQVKRRARTFISPSKSLELQKISSYFAVRWHKDLFEKIAKTRTIQDSWQIEKFRKISLQHEQEEKGIKLSIYILGFIITILFLVIGAIIALLYYFKVVIGNIPDEIELKICEETTPEETEKHAFLKLN